MLCDEARGHLGSEEHRAIDDLLSNLKDQDTLRQMDRVNLLRSKLHSYHINES